MTGKIPRLIVSATGGDGGKTLVSLGLIAELRARGFSVAPFKKGPDFIDAAWLSRAAQRPARHLDTYLMSEPSLRGGFAAGCAGADLALIEGNRGLYDGVDSEGTHSTAALGRLLKAPLLVVLNATKVTRTLAAVALGCQRLEPETTLAGFVLNRVATDRQERVIREAVEASTGLPVIGAIRRLRGRAPLPDRHLGLVTPEEHSTADEAIETARRMVSDGLDVDRLISIASATAELGPGAVASRGGQGAPSGAVRVGVIRDSAFSFYYPENLEALEEEGARLVWLSSLEPSPLPLDLDGLYIGGGFPETHAARISENQSLLNSLKGAAKRGLPIYAECGGLMLLARSISWSGRVFPMAGVLPVDVEVRARPMGHGYCVVRVDETNPFFELGAELKGHEFHYSTVIGTSRPPTAFAVERGSGCFDKRDGLVYKNVLASYVHLHALGEPEWSRGFVRQARRFCRTQHE